MDRRTKTSKITLYGIFAALAMILSYVELQIPAFFAVPGMKLGLTNIVVVVALYVLGEKSALFINLIRILVVSLLFGTVMSLWFSLAGGVLSTLIMILLKRCDKFSPVGVSAAGGITHNIGQIMIAMILLQTKFIVWYLPALWISGVISGVIIGIIGGIVCRHIGSQSLH
ncbi:Gx transporter family protein [Butyrivibrio sp. INlla21]|uniref:Gx transporter family protein n=1 Tax=Butyrivibrio sp. INlla21 TaxID=1520811 RepID=UPI0008E4FBE2|nr:Gx transporter family protein [Butyrivibrio sp. INlla21]SFU30915.1 heptaprenyl diphosphate synthase [Butyrivibrio sp. INlla21]